MASVFVVILIEGTCVASSIRAITSTCVPTCGVGWGGAGTRVRARMFTPKLVCAWRGVLFNFRLLQHKRPRNVLWVFGKD